MRKFWLAVRSIGWALLLPGLAAGYVPWAFFDLREVDFTWRDPLHVIGGLLVASGAALLIACIREFAQSGRGTLSPVDPPKQLVVQGLYRYVRNPMYLSVTMILLGEVLIARSTDLLVYWAIWFAIVNVFVIAYEEPWLRRQFGESYERYTRSVGRWIPGRAQNAKRKAPREG